MNGRLTALACLCALAACGKNTLPSSPPPALPVWTETSLSLEVTCSGFFQGSMRFVANRDQLSASQLDMLSRMTIIDGDPTCVSDLMGCSLTVIQADGSTTNIDAIEDDYVCDQPRKVVSYETFNPFRLSLGCQYAKELTLGHSISGGSPAPVAADARCFNGLFMSGVDAATIPVTLQVDDASAPHQIELDDCAQVGRYGKLSFTVFDSDGVTVLGTSVFPQDAGGFGACAVLAQVFPRTGLFGLLIVVEADATPGGDFSLRFY